MGKWLSRSLIGKNGKTKWYYASSNSPRDCEIVETLNREGVRVSCVYTQKAGVFKDVSTGRESPALKWRRGSRPVYCAKSLGVSDFSDDESVRRSLMKLGVSI